MIETQQQDTSDPARRIRWVATAILASLTGVYLATHLNEAPGWPVLALRAMTEAGMIGGLADWFAVEALFRRPLGLPIPHTAILPNNQKRAARNVGRFFVTYFLNPAEVHPRILALQPAHYAARWLSRPENARRAATLLVQVLALVLKSSGPFQLGDRLRQELLALATQAAPDKKIASEIEILLKSALDRDLIDRLLVMVRGAIQDNRETVVALVQDRSRWWIASRVDRQVADLLLDGVLSVVDELSAPGSSLRSQFETALDGVLARLREDGTITRAVTDGKRLFVETGAFDRLLDALTAGADSRLESTLRNEPDRVAAVLSDPIMQVARNIAENEALGTELNEKIAEVAGQMISEAGPRIGEYVSDIIASWDSDSLNERFEREVGRDLQFIRINGAVLGAMIGGVIFAMTHTLF